MTLRDLLKKKAHIEAEQAANPTTSSAQPVSTLPNPVPEFTFMRTTTLDQEVIAPPSYPGDEAKSRHYANAPLEPTTPTSATKKNENSRTRRLSNLLHRSPPTIKTPDHQRSTSGGSIKSAFPEPGADGTLPAQQLSPRPASSRRLSQRLHLPRSRSSTAASSHSDFVPSDLPDAPIVADGADKESEAAAEASWEKRATLLVEGGAGSRSRSGSNPGDRRSVSGGSGGFARGPPLITVPIGEAEKAEMQITSNEIQARPAMHPRRISDQAGDINILEAIRLHETGDLPRSTAMFGKLADPLGANNALAQVLYALALRHGWGIDPDPPTALTYLTHAASSAASIESAALSTGSSAGGAAKGELVLAIYELANSFRHGWGVARDPVAARQYYETAANLGDTDAMGEVAWCYLEGFGGQKDKLKAAGYLRRREKAGVKIVGESWIWKPKYDPK